MRIRIQGFDDSKFYSREENLIFYIKNCDLYLSLGHYEGCQSCRRSLKSSKKNSQNFITIPSISSLFLFLWVFFAVLGIHDISVRIRIRKALKHADPVPDPGPQYCFFALLGPDQADKSCCGSGSTPLVYLYPYSFFRNLLQVLITRGQRYRTGNRT
jgi:hypothetical protein